ncbi:CG0192-related protein [Nocardioides mesophilus]|uniref:Maltokinase N-terminal cap domain-containing protein n=1 Tax=Nocardioides mesophilus TaxID=433659 RepID=A0A7G9R762_9ACTN|nr:hypothetical protein [Nocardioides mesophilus]QNN51437.1 hypothetical protein H9L09_12560 [Nocardioides mesophilus]
MALIHRATLTPSKLELLTAWLPGRPWSGGGHVVEQGLEQLGAYRFDDPAGEVGIEALLLRAADGRVLHVPVTYRGEPLEGAEEFLVGTTDHSVLGTRWVYDGCGDPVWVSALATAVLGGSTGSEELVEVDGQLEPRRPTASVVGSGSGDTPVGRIDRLSSHDDGPTTVVRAGALEIVLVRVVGAEVDAGQTLTGRWDGGGPAFLAEVRAT